MLSLLTLLTTLAFANPTVIDADVVTLSDLTDKEWVGEPTLIIQELASSNRIWIFFASKMDTNPVNCSGGGYEIGAVYSQNGTSWTLYDEDIISPDSNEPWSCGGKDPTIIVDEHTTPHTWYMHFNTVTSSSRDNIALWTYQTSESITMQSIGSDLYKPAAVFVGLHTKLMTQDSDEYATSEFDYTTYNAGWGTPSGSNLEAYDDYIWSPSLYCTGDQYLYGTYYLEHRDGADEIRLNHAVAENIGGMWFISANPLATWDDDDDDSWTSVSGLYDPVTGGSLIAYAYNDASGDPTIGLALDGSVTKGDLFGRDCSWP